MIELSAGLGPYAYEKHPPGHCHLRLNLAYCKRNARAQCACSPTYVNITPRNEFNLAYTVFVGKVVAIKNTPRDKNDDYFQTVTFEVTKAWKQDVTSNLTITNKIDVCLNGFAKDEEWLVYVYKNKDGSFGSQCCCSRTRLLTTAEDDMKTFADDPPAKILPPQNSKP